MGAISVLQQQIQSLQAQLNALRAEITKYKLREASMIPSPHVDLVPSFRAVSVVAPPPGPPPLPAPPSLPPSPTSSMLHPHQRTPTSYNTVPNDNTSYFS